MGLCRAPGCSAQASGFGAYCTSHKSALRRHGHPDQRAVTKADLVQYLVKVRERIARNPENRTWGLCEGNWGAVVTHASGIMAKAESGVPGPNYERQAAHEVRKLANDTAPRLVIETVFAMFLMLEQDPRRFRSDEAFRFQLVRRVRGLTEANSRVWISSTSGRAKRAYGELSPRAAKVMAGWLVEAFGRVGIHIGRLEAEERKSADQRAEDLSSALRELK